MKTKMKASNNNLVVEKMPEKEMIHVFVSSSRKLVKSVLKQSF